MIKLYRTDVNAIFPTKKNPDDAGWDFYATGEVTLEPNSQAIFDTGWELVEVDQPHFLSSLGKDYLVDIFEGMRCALFAWPKSGMDAKFALHIGAGVIDHIYRGPILLLLKNEGNRIISIPYGTAVAQLVPMLYMNQSFAEVRETGASDRGSDGGITREYKTATIKSEVTRMAESMLNDFNGSQAEPQLSED